MSDLVVEPDGGRMLLLDRSGRVLLIDGGAVQAKPVFDLEGDVHPSGVLGGLMSIALEPGYINSGTFYISCPARWTGFTSEPDGGLLVMGGPNLYRIVAG